MCYNIVYKIKKQHVNFNLKEIQEEGSQERAIEIQDENREKVAKIQDKSQEKIIEDESQEDENVDGFSA